MKLPFMNNRFPFQFQLDAMDCGPSCLKMIAAYYGRNIPLESLREACYISREGVSLLSISEAAENMGMRTLMVQLSYEKLVTDCPLPCIVHWEQNHFVVLYDIDQKKRWLNKLTGRRHQDIITIADPSHDLIKLDKAAFQKSWISSADNRGIVLCLQPAANFFEQEQEQETSKRLSFIFNYLRPYKKLLLQLVFGMLAVSMLSIVFPFLTQVLVDYGVRYKDQHFIVLVLAAQIFLFFGQTAIELVRSWILLHMNARISLSIVSDFLMKLLRLPIRYFDSKAVGDITQRIIDHHRIETFLTGATIDSFFSIITIIVFTVIIGLYSPLILITFLIFSITAMLWIFLFQKRRKHLDYKRFQRNKETQDKLYEMVNGMQEIKLNGSETFKRWEWERLQVKLFKLNIRGLALEQYQKGGFVFLTQLKNILIAFLSAREAIQGHLTLGAMLSISFIVGQTNGPLERLVGFFRSAQDARISMDRLQEIHTKKDEETGSLENAQQSLQNGLPDLTGDIVLEDLYFQYEGPNSPVVLKNINMRIPRGKVTAIVGASGSGKTTLVKLLLNFYNPVQGNIQVGNHHLQQLSPKWWRRQCGTVMQDGYIFADTIARNIAADGREIDHARLKHAITVANLDDFINSLPMGYTTKIGMAGSGISGGQKQRILIARAVYKNPQFLFFDEATSSLDANNEKTIMENLEKFFSNKTVVIIAHRLSTVRNADKIIVLDKGQIVETGDHEMLTRNRGSYYTLVRNQLELGD